MEAIGTSAHFVVDTQAPEDVLGESKRGFFFQVKYFELDQSSEEAEW